MRSTGSGFGLPSPNRNASHGGVSVRGNAQRVISLNHNQRRRYIACMTLEQTFKVSCHCGKLRATATLDPASQPAMMCNCSMCGRTGMLMRFLPANKVHIQSEEGATDFQFGKKNIHHLFCSVCGVRPWAQGTGKDGQPMYAVNLRCLEEFDPLSVEVQQVDGKSL